MADRILIGDAAPAKTAYGASLLKRTYVFAMNLYDLITVLPEDDGFQPVFRILESVSKLDGNRPANLSKLLPLIARLRALIECGTEPVRRFEPLKSWMIQYGAELSQAEVWLRNAFGVNLENRLRQAGFNLSGHYPDLKAGLFALSVDFSTYRATIWYGPRQERLGHCSMWPDTIARRLENLRRTLGGPLTEKTFCEGLEESYLDVSRRMKSAWVPIVGLMDAFVSQQALLCRDCEPRRRRSGRFTRADFSYNLFRYAGLLLSAGLQLRAASLCHTRRRKDFLWVPDSESGSGSAYSYVIWRERNYE